MLQHDDEFRRGRDVQMLRKVISMDTFRGRSSLPRSLHLHDDGPSCMVANFSRASSLGRYSRKAERRAASKENGVLMSHHHDAILSHVECSLGEPPANPNVDESERRLWTVGRISLLILLFVTFTDAAVKVVNTPLHRIDSHEYYDALSMDVIRPAFLYKTSSKAERPSIGLGSAAISSITDALSPILPFAGGVDLRRSEHYSSGNLFESLAALARETYEAYANANAAKKEEDDAPETSTKKTKRKQPSSDAAKKTTRKHVASLGASQPFVPLDNIAELTLEDLATVVDYAVRSTRDGFNSGKFQSGVLPRVRSVIQAMDSAVAKSRGHDIQASKIKLDDTETGKMDALNFCAALRVFAEWRILRQVPDGYKGYAVGMSLGQKDVVQNVAKIERAAHAWIDHQLEIGYSESELRSPTLRDVLEFETDVGAHPNLPRLKETSGAMGLLWVRRQLHYQTVIFENILEVPGRFPSSKEAVQAAYSEVYDKYHGWAVQKIFSYSFQASPKVEEVYKFMNPHRLKEVKEIARTLKSSSKVEELGDKDYFMEEDEQPPENFFHRIGWEIEKIVNGIGQNLGNNKSKSKATKVRGGHISGDSGLNGDELEEFVCSEMSMNVHEHIAEYLAVAKPLLDDLAGLFNELNMDDPTKV